MPHPLGPMNPTIPPAGIMSSTSSSARCSPKSLVAPRTSITPGGASRAGRLGGGGGGREACARAGHWPSSNTLVDAEDGDLLTLGTGQALAGRLGLTTAPSTVTGHRPPTRPARRRTESSPRLRRQLIEGQHPFDDVTLEDVVDLGRIGEQVGQSSPLSSLKASSSGARIVTSRSSISPASPESSSSSSIVLKSPAAKASFAPVEPVVAPGRRRVGPPPPRSDGSGDH